MYVAYCDLCITGLCSVEGGCMYMYVPGIRLLSSSLAEKGSRFRSSQEWGSGPSVSRRGRYEGVSLRRFEWPSSHLQQVCWLYVVFGVIGYLFSDMLVYFCDLCSSLESEVQQLAVQLWILFPMFLSWQKQCLRVWWWFVPWWGRDSSR